MHVVFPASMCAQMPMLRYLESGNARDMPPSAAAAATRRSPRRAGAAAEEEAAAEGAPTLATEAGAAAGPGAAAAGRREAEGWKELEARGKRTAQSEAFFFRGRGCKERCRRPPFGALLAAVVVRIQLSLACSPLLDALFDTKIQMRYDVL